MIVRKGEIYIKIEKLEEGKKYKNYKELCEILEIKISTGNTKNKQLKEIESLVNFHKDGHSFVIDKIYNEYEIKIIKDNRGKNPLSHKNGAYSKYIKLLVLNMLSQNENSSYKNGLIIGKVSMLKELNMINDNYRFGNYNREKMANYLGIDVDYVHEFFNTNTTKLKDAVEKALNSLMNNERLIHHSTIKMVGLYNEHRKATNDEIEFILECEGSALEDMKLKDMKFIYIANLVKDFYHNVNKKIRNEGILYYYNAHEIIFSKYVYTRNEQLMYRLGIEEEINNKTLLNNTISKKLNQSAIARHSKTLKDINELFMGEPNDDWFKKNKYYKTILLKDDFVRNNQNMINMCIDGDYDDICELISKAYVDIDILDENIFDI